ncbi:hypothetical protein E3V39_10820 [Gammaproteobacteria bacterium LSUCC0112]|nr:hypothetical protein E3V39_10820 [Gammaproteobacteria bacterium LSUCC0112]
MTTPATQPVSGKRVLRWVWRVTAAVSVLLLLSLSSLSAVLATHQGSHWLLARLTALMNNNVQTFEYQSAEGTFLRGMSLNGIVWRSGNNQIAIAQLHSRWNPMTLLDGEFILESLRIAGLQIDWDASATPEASPEPLILDNLLNAFLPLPISVRLNNARIDGATIRYGEQMFSLLALAIDGSLSGQTLQLNQLSVDTELLDVETRLSMTLQSPYPVNAEISWQYARPLLENNVPPSGNLTLSGDLDRLGIDHQLSGPGELQSTGTVMLDLARLLNARISTFSPSLDIDHTLASMAAPGTDQLLINSLTLRTQGTPENLGLFAAAHVTATPSAGLSLESDINLRATVRGTQVSIEELALRTATGLLLVEGNVDWTEGLLMELAYQLNDSASDSYLANLPENMSILNLSSRGDIRVQQSSAPGSALQIAFVTPQISALLNDYELTGRGGFSVDGERWQVDGFELQNGDNRIELSALLDNASDAIQATLMVDAPVPGAFYPDLQGQITGQARLTGTLENPVIDVDLTANAIALGAFRAPEITLRGQNRAGMNELELNASDITFLLGEQSESIERVMLRLRGQPDAHSLLLLVDSSLARARINADGALNNGAWRGRLLSSEIASDYGQWQQSSPADLQFQVNDIAISKVCWQMQSTRLCAEANLANSNLLTASASLNDVPLSVFNLAQSEQIIADEAGVTFGGDTTFTTPWRLPFFSLPAGMAVDGQLTLDASASGPINDWREMSININTNSRGDFYIRSDLPDEALTPDDAETTAYVNHFVWPSLRFDANQDNGIWRSSAQLAFTQADRDNTLPPLRGAAEATVQMDSDQNLNGQLQLQFDDLGWIEGLVPQLSQVSGSLNGQLNLGGTLQTPSISGDVNMADAGMNVQALGIELQGIQAALNSDGPNRFLISGMVNSGTGSLNFSSEIDRPFSPARALALSIAGTDFEVADLPDFKLNISPDIRITGDAQGINLSGQLFVPLLNAQISTLPETAVDVSSDVVIVQIEGTSEVRNADLAEQAVLGGIPMSGELRLVLGDNVRVAGFGLNAQVRGQLDISQRPDATPLTYGELEVVEGSFATYGRTLTIEQGKLLFMGSYDNPAIDIRAVRQVENMRVGVQMNGTIRNINSSLFSTPTLPDGDILSVMITGRPIAEIGTQQDGNALIGAMTSLGISQSQGITSQIQNQLGLDAFSIYSSGDVNNSRLMLGKYITPRIFIRYAVGLFETENSLAIDYSVNDRVKLEAKSGQTQSIDLTYTVEQ